MRLLIILLIAFNVCSQEHAWYGRVMPISISNGVGTFSQKAAQNIEIGISKGMLDMGICAGRSSLNFDTTSFCELKLTMDAAQYGIFSNEFSVGLGHQFNSNTPVMMEASYTIMAQLEDEWGLGVVFGYYDFSGKMYEYNRTFYGIYIRYGLKRSDDGQLIPNQRGKKNIL